MTDLIHPGGAPAGICCTPDSLSLVLRYAVSHESIYRNFVTPPKVVADLLWRLLKGRVEALLKAGVHVVFLAHADVRKHDDVEAGTSYDRYMFRAQRLSANRAGSVCGANGTGF